MNTHFIRTKKQKTNKPLLYLRQKSNKHLCRQSNRPALNVDPMAHWQVLSFSKSQCHALKNRHNSIDALSLVLRITARGRNTMAVCSQARQCAVLFLSVHVEDHEINHLEVFKTTQ